VEAEIAAVLVATGEPTERTRQRMDDTGLLMYEMLLDGLDGPRANDDHRCVRGCLVVMPIRWLDRYGWRRPCCHQRAATHAFYREPGAHGHQRHSRFLRGVRGVVRGTRRGPATARRPPGAPPGRGLLARLPIRPSATRW
jgi:hypothetical protein